MTKLTRKLMISVFTLAFALVTLGATTFAWFTLTSTVSVNEIDLTTSVGYGIEISADNQNYKTFITVNEIKEQLGLQSFPQLDPVSTSDGKNFVDKDKFEKDSGYIEFNLYFRSATPSLKVYLAEDTSISSTAKSWTPDVAFTYREANQSPSQSIYVYAADAVRFSLQEYSSGFETGGSITIWELDPSRETEEENIPNQRLGTAIKNDGLINYWAAKGLGELELPTGFVLPAVFDDSFKGIGGQEVLTLSGAPVGNYYYGYLKVRIWIEGWDPDSFDAIFNSPFSLNLKFAVADETGGEVGED